MAAPSNPRANFMTAEQYFRQLDRLNGERATGKSPRVLCGPTTRGVTGNVIDFKAERARRLAQRKNRA